MKKTILLLALLNLSVSNAQDIHKCLSADDKISYSDIECPTGYTELSINPIISFVPGGESNTPERYSLPSLTLTQSTQPPSVEVYNYFEGDRSQEPPTIIINTQEPHRLHYRDVGAPGFVIYNWPGMSSRDRLKNQELLSQPYFRSDYHRGSHH